MPLHIAGACGANSHWHIIGERSLLFRVKDTEHTGDFALLPHEKYEMGKTIDRSLGITSEKAFATSQFTFPTDRFAWVSNALRMKARKRTMKALSKRTVN